MELLDALPGEPVLAGPSLLPDLRPADGILPAPRELDASVDAHPDAAEDAALPALAVVMCVEKLAGLAQVVRARAAKARLMQALPAEVAELYIPDAGQSAA
jgi:hypothetical protein